MLQEIFDIPGGDWRQKLALIVDMMKDMSRQTDPQEMVRSYGEKVRRLMPSDRRLSLSRRGLSPPQFRITRSSTWNEWINPWKDKARLPLLSGGILSELVYSEQPRIIDELVVRDDDPAAEYLTGQQSLMAVPLYDQGLALNWVVLTRKEPRAFSREQFPEVVWLSNLFGRATSNLVMAEELQHAYAALDREFKSVGDIQRSLLPRDLPQIPTLDLAAYYQPSRRAGGDYYDFFSLPDGRWGLFIADVSGHGTPAAVLMAVTHCIAHMHPGPPMPPGKVLEHLNQQLIKHYTGENASFVTAFYGVYDPAVRMLTYASAGHNPPRIKRCRSGTVFQLQEAGGLPLGVSDESLYNESNEQLVPGDQLILYTDGITEAHNPQNELYGTTRLDLVLHNCGQPAGELLTAVLQSVEAFSNGRQADDDRTLIVARVR